MYPQAIERWHALVEQQSLDELDALLADDAVFYSPIVHTPQAGKALVTMYLTGAAHVLFNGKFRYESEVIGEQDAVLEFVTEVDGIQINGVDIIRWNEAGQITEFKVMLRPLKAIQLVHQKMGELLKQMQGG